MTQAKKNLRVGNLLTNWSETEMTKFKHIVHNNTEEKKMRFSYKNKKTRFIGFLFLLACVVSGVFTEQARSTELKVLNSRAYRQIYLNNGPMPLVQVHVEPAVSNAITAYAVEETLPSGITPNSISHDGVWDESTRTIKWGLMYNDPQNRTEPVLSYNVTGIDGSFVLSGKLSIDGYEKEFLGSPLFDDTVTVTGYSESSILVDIIDNSTPAPTVLLEILPAEDRESVVLSNFFNSGELVPSAISEPGVYNDNEGLIVWNIAGNNIAVFSYMVEGASGIFDIDITGVFSNGNPAEDVVIEVNQSIQIFSSVKRDMLNNYTNQPTVVIDVIPTTDVVSYVVMENIPEGVTPFNISDNGVWSPDSRTIKWGLFLNDSSQKSLQYDISGDAGTYELDGTASFNGASADISGENEIHIIYGQGVTRIVRGRILDEFGAPVSGITVEIRNEQGDIVNTVPDNPKQTNLSGRYRFNDVPAGIFYVVPVHGNVLFSPETAVIEVSDESPERIRQDFMYLGELEIGQVTSSFFTDTDNKYQTSSMLLIKAEGNFLPSDIASGTINIASLSTGYVISDQITIDSSSVYYHWDTTDVPPAQDYVVTVEIINNSGEIEIDSSLVIELINNLKGPAVFRNISDLSIPALPTPIQLQRSYNTNSAFDGSLGKGWVHNYSVHIIESSDGWLKLFNADGTGSFFKPQGNGDYVSPKGDKRKLSKLPEGVFKLEDIKKGLEFRFDQYGRLSYIQESHGSRHNLTYENNMVKRVTDPQSGNFIEFTYDGNRKLLQITDSRGRTVTYEYNENGYLAYVTYQKGSDSVVDSYSYDASGRLVQFLDVSNQYTFYSYDTENRIITIENIGGLNRVDYQYNEVESSIIKIDVEDNQTTTAYNLNGQPVSITDNNGTTTYITYNNLAYPISFQDANGNRQWFEYDNNGNILSRTNEVGGTAYFSYDPVTWKLTSVTDFKQKTTSFLYNGYDLTQINFPDGTSESFTYNSNGAVESKTDRNNNTISYLYNSRGQLVRKSFPDSTEHIFTYDSATYNMEKIEYSAGYLDLQYDDYDRITNVTYSDGNVVSYTYNLNMKLSSVIYPDNTVLDYGYDSLNRLVSISSFGQPLVNYSYNSLGEVEVKALGNGSTATYSYDPAGNILELVNRFSNNFVISNFVYTYDNIGNRLSMVSDIGRTDYVYDLNYELVDIIYPSNSTENIVYDESGNRISVTEDGVSTQYSSNDVNQYTQVGNDSYTYDDNGNMVSKITPQGITNYYYDYENHLIRVENPAETILFGYDPFGRRVVKQTSAQTVKYVHDGQRVIMETDNNGVMLKKYYYGIRLDEIIAMVTASQTYYYLYDALGSVTDIVSGDEILLESYTYKAFGLADNEGVIGNSYLFTGREWEPETGLYYYRARYYDPETGRFISADPLGFNAGMNFYTYVFNNPVNRIDPSGLLSFVPSDTPPEPLPQIPVPPELVFPSCPGNRWERVDGPDLDPPINNGDPTFIQPSERKEVELNNNPIEKNALEARIVTPYDDSIIRANVPVFGLACGDNFKQYSVEFGKGTDPQEWTVINQSDIPKSEQISNETLLSLISGDSTIYGNLATWDTGLKNYVYGDEYPADHPVDLNGIYTLRLVVTGINGETVEDRITVEVGRVISNIYGGTACDAERNVVLNIPEHALNDAFVVVSVTPVEAGNIAGKNKPVGKVYEIRPLGEIFTKNVDLEMNVPSHFSGNVNQLGIYCYNSFLGCWEYCPTDCDYNNRKLKTVLTSIPKEQAYFAIIQNTPALTSIISNTAKPYEIYETDFNCPVSDDVFLNYTFDNGLILGWSNRNAAEGALLSVKPRSARSDDMALCLTNQKYGGNFASTIINKPFDAEEYSLIEFDYKIPSDVKINFMVKVDDRWYDIEFTDDPKEYPHLNMEKIGTIEGVEQDNKWHTAKFNLYEMLKNHSPIADNDRFVVQEIVMADWDAAGFMKLVHGNNRAGACYFMDNFVVMKDKPSSWKQIVSKTKNIWNELVLPDSAVANTQDSLLSLDSIQNFSDKNQFVQKTGVFHNDNFKGNINALLIDDLDKGKVVELSYDVQNGGDYAGFYRDLDKIDIQRYKTLSFWIKGTQGKERLRIGIKNTKGQESKLVLGTYLEQGISTVWRKVSIPLDAFSGITDLSAMENISFIFENEFNSKKGKIFITDLAFEESLTPLVIANCSDCTSKTGWGTDYWVFNTNNSDINFVNDKFGSLVHFKGVEASRKLITWSGWGMDLPGIDASDYDCLSFRIKRIHGYEKPNIYMEDSCNRKYVDMEKYCDSSTDWQTVNIPLSDFTSKGIDINSLKKLCFVFEWERMEGAVYVDDIRFTQFSEQSVSREE